MPLIPTETVWFTSERTGFNVKMSGKSVLATYARWWSIPAVIAVLSGTPLYVGLPLAGAIAALYAWSWTWAAVRGAHELRRRDFNQLAFGTRCEPEMMPRLMREQIATALHQRWDRLDAGRSPDDVARFGAKNSGEAVIAYGVLRMAALDGGGRTELDAAERILRGTHDALPADQGPYRDAAQEPVSAPPTSDVIHAQVASAATNVSGGRSPMPPQPGLKRHGKALAAASFIGALAAGAGVSANSAGLRGTEEVKVSELTSHHDTGQYVTITCDQIERYGEFTEYSGKRTLHEVYACEQDQQILPVITGPGDTVDRTVEGQLLPMRNSQLQWPSDVRAEAVPYYIEAGSHSCALAGALGCIAGVLVALGAGAFFIVKSRR